MTTEEKLKEEVTYWKTRCELIEEFIHVKKLNNEHLNHEQKEAYFKYVDFIIDNSK